MNDVLRSGVTVAQLETIAKQFFTGPVGLVLIAASLLYAVVAFARVARLDVPYVAAPTLLTGPEKKFFAVLRKAVGDEFEMFAKVRLGDIIQVREGVTGKRWYSALGRITSKHADFVLSDPRTFAPVLVIELDDPSHNLPARRERDVFFNAALKAAELPVLRVPTQRAYALDDIRQRIDDALSASTVRRS